MIVFVIFVFLYQTSFHVNHRSENFVLMLKTNKCFPSFSSFIFTQLYSINCKIFAPGEDPVPQMSESFRRLDPGSGDDHTFITATSARGLRVGDELYIKGLMGPGLKESIRRVRRGGFCNAGATRWSRVAPILNHHYFEILENYPGPGRALTLGFLIRRNIRVTN